MKYILNILLVILLSISVCGCTKANPVCELYPKMQVNDSLTYKHADYTYKMECKIKPLIKNHQYTTELYDNVVDLTNKFSALTIYPTEDYYKGIIDIPQATKEVAYYSLINAFAQINEHADEWYDYYYSDDYEYDDIHEAGDKKYYGYINRELDKQQIKKGIEDVISFYESKGYFKNYKVVTLFCKDLQKLVDSDITNNLPVYEELLFRVSTKNGFNPQYQYDSFTFGSYYHKDRYYYQKYTK